MRRAHRRAPARGAARYAALHHLRGEGGLTPIVIGASAAGLAVAKCLRDLGVEPIILEAEAQTGIRWREAYERLHLHTPAALSGLPGLPWPRRPRYPARADVVAYLERYAAAFGLAPRWRSPVRQVRPVPGGWAVETPSGALTARHVVFATGANNIPKRPELPGESGFPGAILHARDYRRGADFAGRRVLVVGFGNSACEIALDLAEQGARPALSVRGAVNVLPRDVLGVPILALGGGAGLLPPELADRLAAPLLRALTGPLPAGLRRLPYGPITQIRRHRRIPLLDIGTLRALREGRIGLFPGIARIEGARVHFASGWGDFDAIILATGYRHGIEALISLSAERLASLSEPLAQRPDPGDGLHFAGTFISPRGMLNEIAHEAPVIARRIALTGS